MLALADNVFIIRAMLLRYLRIKNLNRSGGILQEIVRPLIVIVLHFITFWAIAKPTPPGVSIEQFVLGGFTVWFVFIQTVGCLINQNLTGIVAAASPMHARIARGIWPFFLNFCVCYGCVALLQLLGTDIAFPSVRLTFVLFVIAAFLGFGWALLAEVAGHLFPIFEPIIHQLPWLIFLTAGIYFSATSLPPIMLFVDVYNPMLHLLELERSAFNAGYPTFFVNVAYPAKFAVVLFSLGLIVNRLSRNLVHQ